MERGRVFGAVIVLSLLVACRAEPETPLTRAAADGDLASLKALLAAGVDVNARERGGWAPIHWASRAGRVSVLTVLTDAGADPNLKDDRRGWTPLLHAIHKNQAAAVDRLLEAGAAADGGSPGGTTPLIMAAGYGQTEIVRTLLAHGADPRAETTGGRNALWAAAGGGAIADFTDGPPLGACFPATIRTLLETAPDLRLPRGSKATLLRLASSECRPVVAALAEAEPRRASR
jgi:hypothetical protein